ncbi:MAG TPA: hypothetical protein VK970_23225, partial [Candidatus Methylacidiphilales bacterium]|nr:hypothetical protein [Candidatus Methylacidiphilales bacterium]
MKTQQFSSSATSLRATPPWYQRWQVWVPCSLVMAVILCVAAWIVAGVVSRRMYSDTVVELRVAGFPTTLADHHNDLVRRWQEERDAHPVVRHASVRLALFGMRVAPLGLYEPVLYTKAPPDLFPGRIQGTILLSGGFMKVVPVQQSITNLGETFRAGWDSNDISINGEA